MNKIAAILIGIFLWGLTLLEIIILKLGLKLQKTAEYYVAYFIVLAIFLIAASWTYFTFQEPSLSSGLKAGIILIIIGIILDLIITIPMYTHNYYFIISNWKLASYLLILIIPAIAGYFFHNSREKKRRGKGYFLDNIR